MFSPTPEEHVEWLAEALEEFQRANLKLQANEHDIAPVMQNILDSLQNNPEEHSSQILHGRSLKSCIFWEGYTDRILSKCLSSTVSVNKLH